MSQKTLISLVTVLIFFAGCSSVAVVADGSAQKTTSVPETPIQTKTKEAVVDDGAAVVVDGTERRQDVTKIKIETTVGDIEADLDKAKAPRTVENFVALTKKGFYNGIIFHRVIPGFMIQTGDPQGTGAGGPGYKFADEFSADLKHDKPGVFSMANSGPNTNGSQFFITEAPTPWLDGKHSVFGHVTKGIEIVHAIANAQRDPGDKPLKPIKMEKVSVLSE